MPGRTQEEPEFKTLKVTQLHPTFGAEVEGADFVNMSDEQFEEFKAVMAKYGFAVFRNTGLTDDAHVAFARRLGELDNMGRYVTPGHKMRYPQLELFDAGNLDGEGRLVPPDEPRAHFNRGNLLFHADSAFAPRRASFSLLRAVEIPPPGRGLGGATEFADSRAAWDTLDADAELKQRLLAGELVGVYSLTHSRKLGSPAFFAALDAAAAPASVHRLAQVHEPSGRVNLYVGAHLYRIRGLDDDNSGGSGDRDEDEDEDALLIRRLNAHVARPDNVVAVEWTGVGDMVVWDNRAVLHRATGGAYERGAYRRDMRRATVHDDGAYAWGLNRVGDEMPGFEAPGKPGDKV